MLEQKKCKYKLVAGLGNPGKNFENTYHNVGALALSYYARNNLSEKNSGRRAKKALPKFRQHKKLFEYAEIDGMLLVKTLVFMNESGKAIAAAAREFGIKTAEIIVIHDDSDLTLGNFKVSFGKNAGGHNGVQSVINALRSKNFTRIRIGIRPKTEITRRKAETFVLKTVTKKDKETLAGVFKKIIAKVMPFSEVIPNKSASSAIQN